MVNIQATISVDSVTYVITAEESVKGLAVQAIKYAIKELKEDK